MNQSHPPLTACARAFGLLLFSVSCLAQGAKPDGAERPNLSGTWAPNYAPQRTGEQAGAGGDFVLVITHRDPEVAVKRVVGPQSSARAEEMVFYTDKRGETFRYEEPGLPRRPPDEVTVKSKTKWDGKKIRREMTIKRSTRAGMLYSRRVEEWSMSDDGKYLFRETVTRDDNELKISPGGVYGAAQPKIKREVFRLVEKSGP